MLKMTPYDRIKNLSTVNMTWVQVRPELLRKVADLIESVKLVVSEPTDGVLWVGMEKYLEELTREDT